jgi:hypothetical protein
MAKTSMTSFGKYLSPVTVFEYTNMLLGWISGMNVASLFIAATN